MPRSDWNLVANAEFGIPLEQDEQTLIGTFFQQLDDLITLHQREVKVLYLTRVEANRLEKIAVKGSFGVALIGNSLKNVD